MQKKTRLIIPLLIMIALIPIFSYQLGQLFNIIAPNAAFFPFPGDAIINLFLLLILNPGLAIVGVITSAPLALLMIIGHYLVKLGRTGYNVQLIGEKYGISDMIKRGIMPGFFSWALGIQSTIFFREQIISIDTVTPGIIRFLNLATLPFSFVSALSAIPIAAILWSPIWLLEDLGINSFLDAEKNSSRQTPDTEGVGRYYRSLLNGFVGISTFIFIGTFIWNTIQITITSEIRFQQIIVLGTYFLIPLYVILAFVPLLLVHEWAFPKIENVFIRILERGGLLKVPSLSVSEDPMRKDPKETN